MRGNTKTGAYFENDFAQSKRDFSPTSQHVNGG